MGEEEFRQIEEFCRDGCRPAVLPITRSPSRDVVRPEGLDGTLFLSFSVRQFTDGVFQRSGVVRRLVAEAQFSLALAELVARRLGVALVNPFTPADLAAKGMVGIGFEPVIVSPSHGPLCRAAHNFSVAVARPTA